MKPSVTVLLILRLQEAFYPQHEFMQLLNPISSELSQMRVGMWPGLIASMIYNIHQTTKCN